MPHFTLKIEMSVPFSNTHLRVPRGFGAILEGLAREILRDQPEDLPGYAANYFEAQLRQREESGQDPAEWAAKLEDRFYNNHAFKATGKLNEPVVSREKDTEGMISKEISYESLTEDESSHSADISNLPSTQHGVSEEPSSTENTEEEKQEEQSGEEQEKDLEEDNDPFQKYIISTEEVLPREEAVDRVQSEAGEPSASEEEETPIITTFNEDDKEANQESTPDLDENIHKAIHEDELEASELLSHRYLTSNLDVCAQELGAAEGEAGDENKTQDSEKEIGDFEQEEGAEVKELLEVFSYSGPADVDVCSTELGGTEDEINTEDDTYANEEKSSKYPPEIDVEQSLLSVSETPEGNQEEAKDQAEEREEAADSGGSSGGLHESIASIDGGLESNAATKEDSLVEISFEDVPEAETTEELGEKEPEEGDEVSQNKVLDLQEEGLKESEEVTAVETGQNVSDAESHGDPEMVGMEEEAKTVGEELERQLEASDLIKKTVDTNDSILNESDKEEEGEGSKNIITSHQLNPEAQEEEGDHERDNKERIIEEESRQTDDYEKDLDTSNDPIFKDDEASDKLGQDTAITKSEGYSEVQEKESNNGDNVISQVTQSNQLLSEKEAENKTLKTIEQLLDEQDKESRRTNVELQPEETELTLKEETSHTKEHEEEENMETEKQESSDVLCEETVIPIQSEEDPAADHRGSELNTVLPEGDLGHKEECSRPQEEEDIMDIPLDDPEANRAAAKIQAGFRGHMTRKKMKPEDKTEGEEVSSTGDVLNGSQGVTETGGSGAVGRDDTPVPEQ